MIFNICFAAMALHLAARASLPELVCPSSVLVPEAMLNAKVILLGEQHGTREMPKFATDVACQLASKGFAVDVGLEIPADEQARIDEYLRSEGTNADVKALLDSTFWQRSADRQDGRSSVAMFGIIEWVREARRRGSNFRLFAFDVTSTITTDKRSRDEVMAANISARIDHSASDVSLIFAGNYHTMKVSREGSDMKPMGSFLHYPRTLAYFLNHDGGTAWQCSSATRCESNDVGKCPASELAKSQPGNVAREFPNWARQVKAGYDGHIDIGCVSASPPANARQKRVGALMEGMTGSSTIAFKKSA